MTKAELFELLKCSAYCSKERALEALTLLGLPADERMVKHLYQEPMLDQDGKRVMVDKETDIPIDRVVLIALVRKMLA